MTTVGERRFSWLCLLAGGGDAVTGVLLLTLPLLVLRCLGVTVPVDLSSSAAPGGGFDVALLRFIGAFVLAVGTSTLYPFLLPQPLRRLRVTAEVAILARLLISAFLLIAVWRGELAPAWLTVATVDFGWAAVLWWARPASGEIA